MTFSRGTFAKARVERLLVHRYTRVPRVLGATDSWNSPKVDYDAAQTDLACRYRPSRGPGLSAVQGTVGPRGEMVIFQPSLVVKTSDALVAGDLVQDIKDADGTLLLAGPVEVDAVGALAPGGPSLYKTAALKGGAGGA